MKNKSGSDFPSEPAPASEQTSVPAYDTAQWRTLWLRCLEAASAEWRAIPYNDLAISGGDPLKLLRLVLKHYDLSESEARRQVESFLRECRARS